MRSEPRVLIVEDNDVLRAMLFTILRHQPIGVDTAATGDEAFMKVLQCDYALIVIDSDMAHDACERFVRRFREERPEATTFVLAVRDPKIDRHLPAELFSAVLNKPLEIDMLAEVVRETAAVVPQPEDPLPCPPAENDIRSKLERGPYLAN